MRFIPLRLILLLALSLHLGQAWADTRPRVIASFSILGDLVAQVGGDRIQLAVLVGPDQDAHMYQPSPGDSRQIGAANLVIVNGLGFEGWMSRLINASGYQGPVIVATEGLAETAISDTDELDPHTWQNPRHVKRYIHNIGAGLTAIDPAGADHYHRNAQYFLRQLDILDKDIKAAVAKLPATRRTVVTSHDAFGYFSKAYGLNFVAPQGMSTDTEASAKDIAALIQQIRHAQIPAVFVESISDPRQLQQIARETGARIGGTLYSDALSSPGSNADTYLTMMRHNLHTLINALHPHTPEHP